MPTKEFFAESYSEARSRFIAAATDAGAELHAYEHPSQRDPAGGPLSIDVAVMGPKQAASSLVLISGTHGVEGFAGSGCQVGFFRDSLFEALGRDVRAVIVHALNPYGFAWIRRVNEDNVDLNRNFQDFSRPLPRNEAYGALHGILLPADWDGAGRLAADAQLQEFVRQKGFAALQTAVSGGQYSHPNGLFFGGITETWSAATFKQIIATHISPATGRLVAIDLHTGLGPFAYGEPAIISNSARQCELTKARFGPEVKSLNAGHSVSAVLTGTLANAFEIFPSDRDVTFLGLEFGTKPVAEVLTALRGDHWLHTSQNFTSSFRDQIKKDLRDAFYVNAPHWQAAVYGRTADFIVRAARALVETPRRSA